jgi:hypothetical protein
MLSGRATNFAKCFIFKQLVCGLMLAAGVLAASQARAATLYLSPSFGSGSVGKTFAVTVYVSSKDAINAASGVVSFPNDQLELVSLTKTGSIFNLWVAEPSFSQSAGTFSFEGIILNPGYTGTAGKIVWANFRIKAAGSAKLSFTSGAVLANDGEGTNILSGFGSATFNLVDSGAPKPTAETPKPATAETPKPAATPATPVPKISSDTNPDQNKWYASSRVRLSWPVPSGVTAVRLLLSSSPSDAPTITYAPAINAKELTDLRDGVYYFSARFQDANGWGDIARYTLRIDTTPPEPIIVNPLDGPVTANPEPKLKLVTKDNLSGIDRYLIEIGDEPAIIIKAEELIDGVFALPPQIPGVKHIVIEAYDKAGNRVSTEAKLEIQGGAPGSINLALTGWLERVRVGDNLTIKGKTRGRNQITVYWQKDSEPAEAHAVVSDSQGNFSATIRVGEIGNYQVWAEIKDAQGLTIAGSDKVNIVAYQSITRIIFSLLRRFWWILLLIVVGVLAYVFRRSWWGRGRPQNNQRLNRVLYTSLHSLRDGIKAQIKVLTNAKAKRCLNREEAVVMNGLKKTLSNTDRFLAKEIVIIKRKRQTKK